MPPNAPHSLHHKRAHAISQDRPLQDRRAPAGGCGPGPSQSPGVLGATVDALLALLWGYHPAAPENKFGCPAPAKPMLSAEAQKILAKPAATPKPLADGDFQNAATKLGAGVSVEIIRAFAEVESGGRSGFGADNLPIIAYEGHIFRRYTQKKYDKDHPYLSYKYVKKAGPEWQHNNKDQKTAWQTLADAMALDYTAAVKACSWGMFQVMGFNYASCGYKNVTDFALAMKADEAGQLDAFVGYCQATSGLVTALVNLDYATLAELYNGEDYGDYDKRIEKHYKKLIAAKAKAAAPGTPPAPAKPGAATPGPRKPGV